MGYFWKEIKERGVVSWVSVFCRVLQSHNGLGIMVAFYGYHGLHEFFFVSIHPHLYDIESIGY